MKRLKLFKLSPNLLVWILLATNLLVRTYAYHYFDQRAQEVMPAAGYPYPVVEQDSIGYGFVAFNLARGRGFTSSLENEPFNPQTTLMPFYSVLLLGVNTALGLNDTLPSRLYPERTGATLLYTNGSGRVLSALNHIAGAFTTVGLAFAVLWFSGAAWPALIAGLAYTVFPLKLTVDNVMLPDAWVILFCVWAFAFWIRHLKTKLNGHLWTSAVFLNFASMAKPVGLPFSMPLMVGLILFRCFEEGFTRRTLLAALKPAAVFLIAANLFSTAWSIRNGSHTGIYVASDFQYKTLWNFTAVGVVMESQGLNASVANQQVEQAGIARENKIAEKLGRPLNDSERNYAWHLAAREIVQAHPAALVQGLLKHGRAVLRPTDGLELWPTLERWMLKSIYILFTIIFASAVLRLFFPRQMQALLPQTSRGTIAVIAVLLVMIGAFGLVSFPFPFMRYKSFFQPYLFVGSGLGLAVLANLITYLPNEGKLK